jgi:hypothetical protein
MPVRIWLVAVPDLSAQLWRPRLPDILAESADAVAAFLDAIRRAA